MHEKEDAPQSGGEDDPSASSKVFGVAPSKEGSLPEVSRERSRTPPRASPEEVNTDDITKGDDLQDATFIFSDSECSSVFVIEACAGSAMLSSVLQQYGFETLPIDFGGNKRRPYVHLGIFWSLENPGNSYMWYIPQMVALAKLGFWVYFHSCCHGGDRKKHTAFLTSCPEFRGLEAVCDKQHEHAKWGLIRHEGKVVFATSREAASGSCVKEFLSC